MSIAANSLDELYPQLEDLLMMPGWNRRQPALWVEPRKTFQPHHWSYREAKAGLDAAGRWVSTELAERRNLILTNPAATAEYPTNRTLVNAYQMILPGERARTHRHTPHAGRLILDCEEGAYTIVDGVRIDMRPGDVLLTPGWCWHGHGNDGSQPAYWLDYLDVPLVHYMEPMFFEEFPDGFQEPELVSRDSPYVFAWDDTLEQLDGAEPDREGFFGRRVQLGEPALPTMALYMQRLEAGEQTEPYQTSANYHYCVVEGGGSSVIDDKEFTWGKGDVFVAPSWRVQRHFAAERSILFAMTDEPLQAYCGYLRTAGDVAR
jgi:gentisate 1,2-dioxygenase